jgi:hypothetical protein
MSTDPDWLLKVIWDGICEKYEGDARGEPGFDSSDIDVVQTTAGGFPCIVVVMPEPTTVTEAYYVAVILREDDDPGFEYFTLEISFGGSNVLGGWRTSSSIRPDLPPKAAGGSSFGDGAMHANYGIGTKDVSVESFISIVERVMAR